MACLGIPAHPSFSLSVVHRAPSLPTSQRELACRSVGRAPLLPVLRVYTLLSSAFASRETSAFFAAAQLAAPNTAAASELYAPRASLCVRTRVARRFLSSPARGRCREKGSVLSTHFAMRWTVLALVAAWADGLTSLQGRLRRLRDAELLTRRTRAVACSAWAELTLGKTLPEQLRFEPGFNAKCSSLVYSYEY